MIPERKIPERKNPEPRKIPEPRKTRSRETPDRFGVMRLGFGVLPVVQIPSAHGNAIICTHSAHVCTKVLLFAHTLLIHATKCYYMHTFCSYMPPSAIICTHSCMLFKEMLLFTHILLLYARKCYFFSDRIQ